MINWRTPGNEIGGILRPVRTRIGSRKGVTSQYSIYGYCQQPTFMYIYIYTYVYIFYLFIYLFIHSFIYLFMCLFIYLFIYLFMCKQITNIYIYIYIYIYGTPSKTHAFTKFTVMVFVVFWAYF